MTNEYAETINKGLCERDELIGALIDAIALIERLNPARHSLAEAQLKALKATLNRISPI